MRLNMSLQRLYGAVYLTVAILGCLLSHSSGQTTCSFSCEPITTSQCSSQSYSNTGFPNFYNHSSQKRAAEFAKNIDIAEAFKCYVNSRTFICGLLLPECRKNEGLILPSRQLCMEFFAGCGNILEITGNSHLILDCTMFALNPIPICNQPGNRPPVPTTQVPIMMPAVDRDAFAIITDLITGTILTGPISTFELIQVPLNGVSTPVAVDYDPLEEMMYWTDTGMRTISRARLDGTAQEVVVTLSSRSVAEGLVLDVGNKQIFWTDTAENTIESASMDGGNRNIILHENLDQPMGIILESAGRHLFWTDIGTPAKIERANYDGSERVTLIDTDIQTPNGLAIDFSVQKIYWCDEGLGRIESSDLEGGNRNVLISSFSISNVFQPYDIGIYMGYAYWTDWQLETIIRTDHFGNPEVVGPPLSRPGGLRIQQDIKQPILECPSVEEQFVVTDQLEVEVLWSKPTYSDNSGQLGDISSTHTSPSMFGIGVHTVTYSARDPYGNTASCSITITVTAACPENSKIVNLTPISWLQTPALNQVVDSNERCDVATENRGRGLATQVCMRDEIRTALWVESIFVGCGEKENFNLADLSKTPVVDSNVENVAEALNNVTQQQSDEEFDLTTDDLQHIADTLGNIVDVESVTPEVTMTVIQIANNLVDLTEQSETNQAAGSGYYVDILLAIEQQVNRSTASGQNLTIVEPNIAVTITTVLPNQPTGFSFAVLDSNRDEFREEDIQTYSDPENIPRERRMAVILPRTIFNTTSNDSIGVSFVVHNNDVLYPTISTNQTVGSDIVSAIVTGVENIENLSQPVVFEFTVTGENAYCVFWDFDIPGWSSEGCQLIEVTTDNQTTCHCNHLTNFAVLVDIYGQTTLTKTQDHILEILSYIGCCLSVVGLMVTILTYATSKTLRSRKSNKILMNLCSALTGLYLVFIAMISVDIERGETEVVGIGCGVLAGLLHYFTLASLCWMAVEAANMYLLFVRVINSYVPSLLTKAALVGWGIPAIIVVVTGAASRTSYFRADFCFLQTIPLVGGVLVPIGLIMIFNIVMFVLITISLSRQRPGSVLQRKKKKAQSRRIRNAFAITLLLGITWGFGFLGLIRVATFFTQLLFCVINAMQGYLIFMMYCVQQPEVRNHWKRCFKTLDRNTSSTHSYNRSNPILNIQPKPELSIWTHM